jgi:hypothetical protein
LVAKATIMGVEAMTDKKHTVRVQFTAGKNRAFIKGIPCLLLMLSHVSGSFAGLTGDVEERLNRYYSRHSESRWGFSFTHSVQEYPEYVEIRMLLHDERKVKIHWKNRSRMRFQGFVERVGRLASQLLEKDARIMVADGEGKVLASYEFIRERNILKPAILGFSRFDEVNRQQYPLTISAFENVLERRFGVYDGEDFLFLFDYSVIRTGTTLRVTARAENFSIEDAVWKERDAGAFENFVERIWIFVRDRTGRELTVIVLDRNGLLITEYEKTF